MARRSLRRTARRATRALSALVLLAMGALACGGADVPPSIVLVSIDTLRADRLGIYGAERDTSPAIDALAAEGARFTEAMAPSPWTLPSHVSLLTGLNPLSHRVSAPFHRIDPARHLLAEHLRSHGYRTAGFVSAPFLHEAYGFARGFDTYRNHEGDFELKIQPDREAHDLSHAEETASAVVDDALGWLEDRRDPGDPDAPWFLFVHIWDPHYDFLPPPPYDTLFDPDYAGHLDARNFEGNEAIHESMPPRDLAHLLALYDGEIRWVDSQLARLFDAVRARDDGRPVLLVLTADHGEEFFEHGKKGHMKALYEESVRVPLLVRYPGVVPTGLVVDGAVSLEDVAPTLLGLAGLDPLPEATGRDLSAPLREGRDRIEGERLLNMGAQVALRGPGWKVLRDLGSGYAVHYDLADDPGEQSPQKVRRVAPERLERLEAAFQAAQDHAEALEWRGEGALADLDEETRERLRELGYIE